LIEMPTLKPIDSKAVIDMAGEVKYLFTVEEHNLTGGLNTAVCEVLARSFPKKVYPIATNDIYGESGSPAELAVKYGLDGKGIYKGIKKAIDN
ncbi:MAG: transketolase family protein, partial [Actinomycetia bacterium]|nr:transketolase family protein [Actinomycetes bacterium]